MSSWENFVLFLVWVTESVVYFVWFLALLAVAAIVVPIAIFVGLTILLTVIFCGIFAIIFLYLVEWIQQLLGWD